MEKKLLDDYFDARREEFVADIASLVKIASPRQDAKEGAPFGEGPAKALEEAMAIGERMGLKVIDYDHYVAAFDLNEKERGLDILAHLDVVPAGDDWTVTEPYSPKVVNSRIYGRGTADDKGPAVAALWALK